MYSEQERQIFKYVYEGKERCQDPSKLWRAWGRASKGHDIQGLLTRINAENPTGDESIYEQAEFATETLIGIIAETFDIKPLSEDGRGATEVEMLDIWGKFEAFLFEKKTKDENSPTCGPPTAAAQEATNSVTQSGSGSG